MTLHRTLNSNKDINIAILGGGNIGAAMAKGFVKSGKMQPERISITRRNFHLLDFLANQGYVVHSDNRKAVNISSVIIISVQPQQLNKLLQEIKGDLSTEKHLIISVVTGVTIKEIKDQVGRDIPVIRAMPNMAIANGVSMTCLVSDEINRKELNQVKEIFNYVGETLEISESHMVPATALVACGVAFFLRAIRAASQGGIEIGFHSDESLLLAAQTAKGAASLILKSKGHPESEIDKVTTPRGCTIAGLNEMEHQGFSSAMIRGILTSSEIAARLYKD